MAPLSSLTALVTKTTKGVKSLRVRGLAKQITVDPALNEGVVAMMERAPEMSSPVAALLAGIAADPKSRRMWEQSLDAMWTEEGDGYGAKASTTYYPEVFIGGGLSGAIWCATRAAMGSPVPLVLEADERVGGAFAVSHSPTFYLNSRNRPGGLGVPGSQGSLNFLPNAPVQPSELGFEEYQVNSDMAFAIRAVYALTDATVLPKTSIYGMNMEPAPPKSGEDYIVKLRTSRGTIQAGRVVVGTGLGQPRQEWYAGKRLLSFKEFMRRLDEPFPFRNIGRVAVIGAGDSGKVVIEALTGQGPSHHMTVAALDYPSEINWYGQPWVTKGDFEQCNRPRYRKIGGLFGGTNFRGQRVTPLSSKVTYVEEGYDSVLVDGQPFDLAINCTGFQRGSYVLGMDLDSQQYWLSGSENDYYARYAEDEFGNPKIFFVGPAAQLPRSDAEQKAVPNATDEGRQRELMVAAWRYSGRTAMVARDS